MIKDFNGWSIVKFNGCDLALIAEDITRQRLIVFDEGS